MRTNKDKHEDKEKMTPEGVPKEPTFEAGHSMPGMPGSGTENVANPNDKEAAALVAHGQDVESDEEKKDIAALTELTNAMKSIKGKHFVDSLKVLSRHPC